MLEEAVEIIRRLWQGGVQSHYGAHYVVDRARLYTLPDEPPPILFAASGKKATELAARAGDGIIGLAADREFIQRFEASGGRGKPRYAQVHVCYGRDEAAARKLAHHVWAFSALPGNLFVELPTPGLFEQACELVDEAMIGEQIVCGPDAERHAAAFRRFLDAGFDHVYVHQIGPDQEGCIRFYEKEVLRRLR